MPRLLTPKPKPAPAAVQPPELIRAAILAEIDRVSPYSQGEGPSRPVGLTPFATADELHIATERDQEGQVRITFLPRRPAGRRRDLRTYCKGDRAKVRRLLMRDPGEIAILTATL